MSAKVTRLTNLQKQLLSNGNVVKFNQYVANLRKTPTVDTPIDHGIEQLRSTIVTLLNNNMAKKFRPLLDFENKANEKWFGPQGRQHKYKDVIHETLSYYKNANCVPTHMPDGINFVINLLQQAGVRKGSLHPLDYLEALDLTSKNTHGGISTFGKKNDPAVQMLMTKDLPIVDEINELRPVLTSVRDMRNRLRTIFMDDMKNVVTTQRFMQPVFNALKSMEMGTQMWRGFFSFERYITPHLKSTTLILEGDADAMDKWVNIDNVQAYVTPILHWLYPERYHKVVDQIVTKSFTCKCVVGDFMIEGDHALFSGMNITNLFETIMMLVILAQMLYDTKFKNRTLLDYAIIEVIGDDQLVLLDIDGNSYRDAHFHNKYGELKLQKLLTMYLTFAGLKANISKQRVAVGNFFYCKRWYSTNCPVITTVYGLPSIISIPSLVLKTNSILNPEHGFGTNPKEELLRRLSITDEAYGHPLWINWLQLMYADIDVKQYNESDLDIELAYYNSRIERDWKRSLLGEFTLKESPTWQYLIHGAVTQQAARKYTL